MKKHVLKNGLNIILKSMPNTHSITVGMYVRAGTRYENDDDNGIVHFLEHLHFRQLGIISQEELYYNMESMGSTLRAATYYDFLKFSMKIHPRYLENCLDVFKNIISANNWNAENFQTEKEIVKVQINEAGFMFSNKHTIRASLFGNSNLSFGIMGNTETVDSIDLPRIIAYKEKVFNKNNLLLCVTGCFNSQDVKLIQEKLEKIDINDGKKYIPMDFPKLLYHRNPNIILNNDDWDYFDVNISFDIDYNFISIDELIILNCILGEGVGSRLQKCIREKMNYTSNIYSEIEMYEDFSMLHIKLSVQKNISQMHKKDF